MKRTAWIKKVVAVLLILAMCLGGIHGIVPNTVRAAEQMGTSGNNTAGMVLQKSRVSANPDAVDAEINVEKIDLPAGFIEGVDVSSYDSLKNSGVRFYDFDGNELDYGGFFTLLKDSGINYVRLRVWNNPFDSDGHGYGGGNSSIENAKKMGKAASDAGLKVLIDFHYSDFWADAGKQKSPKAWADYTVDQKADAIEEYTYDSLKELIDAGVDVGMVQIGNETNSMLCGENYWNNLARLYNAGAKAVRNVASGWGKNILVALHFTNPEQPGNYAEIAKLLNDNNVDYDVFASSYYPDRHGTLENLKSVLSDVAIKYNKKVMVAETSWARTLADGDGYNNTISGSSAGIDAYPVSVQGQADAVSAVIGTIADTTNGIGVFYWEPAWIPVQVYNPDAEDAAAVLEQNKQKWEEYGSGWASSYVQSYDEEAAQICGGSRVDNQAMFDFEGHPLDSLNVWKYVKTGAVAPAKEHKHNDVTFTPWTATNSLPTAAGNYYLTDNVTLSETWNAPNGETNLCLNGKTITQTTNSKWTISIGSGSTCKLYDCEDGGKITGKRGVSVGGGTFDMYGGSISDIRSDYAAVYVHDQGTFHMSGGRISDNENKSIGVNSNDIGGGVNVNKGTFYMSGGEISRNSKYGSIGDGVNVSDGAFYMNGGKISENKNGVNVSQSAEFYMSGGEVSGNTGAYGGVCIWGTMTAGGNIVITGNAGTNGEEKNLFIQSGVIRIDISNMLADTVNIGVTTGTAPTDANPVNITGENGTDYSGHFHSDNADYEIVNGANNVVQLAVKASPDTQPPTGKIEVATGNLTSASWTEFLAPDQVAFNLFFKDRKWVTIFSADEGGSGVYGTHYYVSNDALTKAQVEALDADAWTANATVILEPEPDRKCIVYAKITDGAGNVTYLSSDGLVFDTTPPVINGVTDGGTYNTPQTVTVTDALSGVKSVTVNGAEVTLTDAQFTLGTADAPQTIIVTDKAGNTTTVTVTVRAQAQSYAVTVHNGTGTGIYRAGDTVTITADAPPSGKQFDKWQVGRGSVTLADSMSSTTTFTMPERDVYVEALYKDMTEEHTHNYGDWQHDDTQHWKVCACGEETGRANHDFGDWITDKAATAAEAGTRHRECQTCGSRQTEMIPATGSDLGSGTVTPEVKPGTNAPATNISTPTEKLKDMLLTDDEKQQVQNGTNIRIVLEVQDAGNTVSASDQVAVSQALNGHTVGEYLNIDLYKLVGVNRTDITETAKKIRIVITVPDILKNADSSKTRAFAVIRVHDGRAELLTDLDGSADTITIETDRFSTYAIVYKDTANSGNDDNHGSDDDNNGGENGNGGNDINSGGNDNGGNGSNGGGNDNGSNGSDNSSQNDSDKNDTKPDSTKDDEPKTGGNTPLELYATLAMIAGFAYLLLYFTDRKGGMTEETKKELVSRLVGWAKRGGRIRKCLALAAVSVLLVYYHGIGKKTCAEWEEIYGE